MNLPLAKQMRAAGDLVRDRVPLVDGFTDFLNKPLPRNVGWLQTLGSLLAFYIVLQTVTGILLAFYYSNSTETAFQSISYIRGELRLGALLLALHRFGAGFIIVTAFLHFTRVYFSAAYRKPREFVWITGLLLGVLLTLFAFTGQLLPYDQHGYWATVVGIRIAASAPGLEAPLQDVLTGGFGSIGTTTLSRFYVLHIAVLPLVFFALMGLHFKLLQKAGSAGPLEGSPDPKHSFYPSQLLKDLLVSTVGALALFLMAWFVPATEYGPASSQAGNFVPRPEWFFYAHYELLKLLPSNMQVLGTFVLPNVLLGLLLALPFLDRGQDRRFRARRLQVTLGALLVVGILVLTTKGFLEASAEASKREAQSQGQEAIADGPTLFEKKGCVKCHTIQGRGGDKGPDLSHVARRLKPGYFKPWIRRPQDLDPNTDMPSFEGSEEELGVLVHYLRTLK